MPPGLATNLIGFGGARPWETQRNLSKGGASCAAPRPRRGSTRERANNPRAPRSPRRTQMILAEARIRDAPSKDLDGEGTRANSPPAVRATLPRDALVANRKTG